jgi:hypothetical protein
MIKIERSADPYPKFSFMTLAERASYESPDEEAKNQFRLRPHLKSNHLNPGLFLHGVSQES